MRYAFFCDSLRPELDIAAGRQGEAVQGHRMLRASGIWERRPGQQQGDQPAATGTALVTFHFTDRPQAKDNSPAAASFLFLDEAKTALELEFSVPPQDEAWLTDIWRDAQTRGQQLTVLFSHDSGPWVSRYQILAGSPRHMIPGHHTGDAA